jgi:hypothetical protein
MTPREAVARAVAFFEATDDIALLHTELERVAPRVRRMVTKLLARGTEETLPEPAGIRAARELAPREEAVATLRATEDFGLLQVLARAIGRRIEALEIAASADFPAGVRVVVPAQPRYPRAGQPLAGEVESSGTVLTVRLDNGDSWQGPPSLAALEPRQ